MADIHQFGWAGANGVQSQRHLASPLRSIDFTNPNNASAKNLSFTHSSIQGVKPSKQKSLKRKNP
jgi:hypothetical protein